ncbi:hypothetical protein [Actinoplanes derwentensis]|uniref:Uncharacterized protein n=1 Tax=Actinoplanes derwentensis TaxID=113562 RepID=A0A1H2D9K2_9ACTN|nr:hypothetical protein [Actinoplanes derwentensis]GID81595.1 hypothetical protein Ade03nite_05190 [Actinoplanes derwentensis]SDT79391.1 hypothetical protein SAMN04489716_8767 [Actinoplanes derwentensis]
MDNGGFETPRDRDRPDASVRGPWHSVDFDTLPPADIIIEVDRVVPTLRELRPPVADPDFAAGVVENLDWAALTHPDMSPWEYQPDLERIGRQLSRIDTLLARVTRLPVPADRLATNLADVGACLTELTRTCRDLGATDLRPQPADDEVRGQEADDESRRPPDADEWIAELDRAITGLERGDGPRRPAANLTVRDGHAVMYVLGDTVHVVHHCAVDRPVIEVATLVDYDEAGDTEVWFHGIEPPRRPGGRILRSHGVSISTGNQRRDVFEHRIGPCPLALGALVALPGVRPAIHACRTGADGTRPALHAAVRQAVAAVDISALITNTARPPGTGVRLTVRHGAGSRSDRTG